MGSLISWNVKISVSMLIFYWSTDYFNIHPRSRKVRGKYSKLKAKKFCIEPMRNTESSNSVRFNSDHCEYRDKAILNKGRSAFYLGNHCKRTRIWTIELFVHYLGNHCKRTRILTVELFVHYLGNHCKRTRIWTIELFVLYLGNHCKRTRM